MLYQAYQAHADIMVPVRRLAGMAAKSVGERLNGSARPTMLSNLTAAYELIARAGLTHERPPYGIEGVTVGDRQVAVTEEAADVTPFGTLLHFKKDTTVAQPRHYRGTSPHCCARPYERCWPSMTSSLRIGTTRATSLLRKGVSDSMIT
jgi:poly-beta-hydroxyalkanoate depolymerase